MQERELDFVGALGTDVLLGLVASFAWALATTIRLAGPSLEVFAASFGCASVHVVPITVLARRVRALPRRVTTWLAAFAMAAGPLAVLGAFLKEKTHHRALGGVTFAVSGTVVTLFAFAVARRLRALGGSSRAGAAVARAAVVVLATGSLGVAIVPLVVSASPGSTLRAGLLDAAVGVACTAPFVFAPVRKSLLPTKAAVPLLLWAASVALGTWAVKRDSALSSWLAERAPLTLGITRDPRAE
jgi:hypothetical protein